MITKISHLLLCCLLARVQCLFEFCNHKIEMKPNEKLYINSPYYPAEYPKGSSCRYAITAPQHYKLQFVCNIRMTLPPFVTTCQNDFFFFNGEGSEILTESEYFCGTGKMERTSFLNQAVISYISIADHRRTQMQAKTNAMEGEEKVDEEKKSNAENKKAEIKTAKESEKIKATTTTRTPTTTSKLLKEHQLTTLTAAITKPTATATATTTKPIAVKNNALTTSSTTPLPTSSNVLALEANMKSVKQQPAIEKDKKVNNPFAYVVTLWAHKSDKGPTNLAKLVKGNTTTATTIATTTTIAIKPTSSIPTNVLKFNELLPASRWRNDSMATTKTSTKRVARVIVGQDYTTYATSAVTNATSFKAEEGGGSFSCLVEVVQPPCECGWSSATKIVGGSPVTGTEEFPSMAGIMTIAGRQVFCGAIIIHHRYLLSAAHCYLGTGTNNPEYLTAVVGEHDMTTVVDSYIHQHDLIEIIVHEQYESTSTVYHNRNDIALLKTRFAIEWSRTVAPACLPFLGPNNNQKGTPHAGQRVEAAGWGTTSFGGPQSSLLLKTTLDVIAPSTCQYLIGKLPLGVFCTYTPGRDTCQYDSGGGLYIRGERMFAVGMASYGYGCATTKPSVNVRISSYLKWIKNKTPEVKYCVR